MGGQLVLACGVVADKCPGPSLVSSPRVVHGLVRLFRRLLGGGQRGVAGNVVSNAGLRLVACIFVGDHCRRANGTQSGDPTAGLGTTGSFSMFVVLIVGVLCGGLETRAGTTLTGLVLIGMAAWLARFDVARRTVRHPGMPRYVAVGLLSGFVWLAVAGVLALTQPLLFGGFVYDGILHSVFLGFVFSMIFAHAPMIFPAILHVRVPYHWVFYLHWLTLHVSLTLRVLGDISGSWFLRTWGILGNGAALALFLATTLTQVLRGAQQQNHAAVRARG